jgi:sulfur-oxidizing protein SoxA
MQDDDVVNPGLLWVLDGEALWRRKSGAAERACADCHGDARTSMKGVAVRYPAFDATRRRPVNLEQRINACRTDHQQAPPLALEGRELLALSAYVARQSRGLPIEIAVDERTKPFLDAGRAAFFRRQGQLNLACTQCHDERWGKKLAGSPIPQAHPTGYPLYRLEWQGLGSLQRRLRNCFVGVRAEAYEYGAPEFVDLELYLMWRARGMTFEAPAVRP